MTIRIIDDEPTLAEDLTLDDSDLEREWIRQPSTFLKYSEMAARARHKENQAENFLKFTLAQLAATARANPDMFGLDKVTDKAVDVVVETHDDTQSAREELAKAQLESQLAYAAMRAMEEKLKALEFVTRMQLSGFSNIDGDLTKVSDMKKSAQNNTRERAGKLIKSRKGNE